MHRLFLRPLLRPALAALALLATACEPPAIEDASPEDIDIPLTRITLKDGAPKNDELPTEGKTDAIYPERYDLVSQQSPVKSQGSRGVCSIFAATALAEHLYKVGTGTTYDFSEQYVQWSVKTQVRGWPDSEGSSANYNLRVFSDFGAVEERVWPYQDQPWNSSNDPACTGKEPAPSRCWTNGAPPTAAESAPKFKLPAGRYLNSGVTTIKAHMVSKKTGVIAGGDFFYQSWNHRRSKLPVNAEYWRQGYVLSPNAEDRIESGKSPAGHEILLVGWDDTLEVQKVDKDGKGVVDASGRPVKEKGFFLFKNSWGNNSFGVGNRKGAGYGWISYAYVTNEFSAYVSAPPQVVELCGDGLDNDRNGRTDCADSACSRHSTCTSSGGGSTGGGSTGGGSAGGSTSASSKTFTRTVNKAIPDNSATGLRSYVDVSDTGTVKGVRLSLDITHSYRGDLTVTLERDGVVIKVVEADGDEARDIKDTFTVTGLNGKAWKGRWTVRVVDVARGDTGTLNGWTLTLQK